MVPDICLPLSDSDLNSIPESDRYDRLTDLLKKHLSAILGNSGVKAGLVIAILNSLIQKGEIRKYEKYAVLLLKYPLVFEFLFAFSLNGVPVQPPSGIKKIKTIEISAALNADYSSCAVFAVLCKEKSLEKAQALLSGSNIDLVLKSVKQFKGNLQKWWNSL